MNGNSARLGSCKTVPRFLGGCSWTTFEWPSQLSVYGAITSHIYLLPKYCYQIMINKQCFTGRDVSMIQQGKRSRWSMWLRLHRFSKAKLPFHRRLLVKIHWKVQRYINIGNRSGVSQCLSRSEMPPACKRRHGGKSRRWRLGVRLKSSMRQIYVFMILCFQKGATIRK